MVKRQKEKQYLSARESRSYQSLRSGSHPTATTTSGHTRPLPFHVCALSLNPYTNPVATPSGVIFDSSVIIPHLLKTGRDPVTGQPLATKDLIALRMDRSEETGNWQCPVLEKAFTDRTKVVAIRQNPPGNEANVYSYEAVQELNFKTKNYEDLTSGKKFHKTKDVIVLQDPDDAELCRLRDINNFAHIASGGGGGASSSGGGGTGGASSSSGDVRHSVTATRIMEKIKRKREEEAEVEAKKKRQILKAGGDNTAEMKNNGKGGNNVAAAAADAGYGDMKIYTADLLGTSMTSGKAASSLTSTAVEIANVNELREATAEEILDSRFRMMKRLKKKGFVRLTTTKGTIDLEVHADIVPRTATNFLGLVEAGKYDGSVFHRSIKNFMIQGGKPADKTEKEESLWGGAFSDEFDDRLSHSGPGILSMANAGAGTNKRQFFLTFKSCAHLDRKHSVFGRVVKGLDVLRAMEAVPTGKGDRPTEDIKILTAEIMGKNPATVAAEAERERIQERAEARIKEREERQASALGRNGGGATAGVSSAKSTSNVGDVEAKKAGGSSKSGSSGVGKYLPKNMIVQSLDDLGNLTSQGIGGGGGGGGGEMKQRRKTSGTATSASGDFAALPGIEAAVAASRKSTKKAPIKKAKNWDFSGW